MFNDLILPSLGVVVASILFLISLIQTIRLRRVGVIASRQQAMLGSERPCPDVSIIVTCQEQQPQLKQLLPLLLSQHYRGEYEVIVVDKLGNRDMAEWLEDMEEHYPHLHHTFCPATARDISIQRLALSLGVKASNFEWLVFLSVETQLPGDGWLSHLMTFCDGNSDAVLGIANYASGGGWFGQKVRWSRIWEQLAWLPYALHHAPYCIHPELLCYRRSYFLAHQGFASSGLLAVGALELLVNHNIKKGRCGVNFLPEAAVKLPLPSPYIWKREQLYNVDTRWHLHRFFLPKLAGIVHTWPFLLFTVAILLQLPLDDGDFRYFLYPSLWVVLVVAHYLMLRPSCKPLGLNHPPILLPLLLIWLPLSRFSAWQRWCFTKKGLFRKKFV